MCEIIKKQNQQKLLCMSVKETTKINFSQKTNACSKSNNEIVEAFAWHKQKG